MKNETICIKSIPYQEILNLKDSIERLQSWQETLTSLDHFFTNPTTPINKRKVTKLYYANAKLFQTFYTDFALLLDEEEKILQKMIEGKKVKEHRPSSSNTLT